MQPAASLATQSEQTALVAAGGPHCPGRRRCRSGPGQAEREQRHLGRSWGRAQVPTQGCLSAQARPRAVRTGDTTGGRGSAPPNPGWLAVCLSPRGHPPTGTRGRRPQGLPQSRGLYFQDRILTQSLKQPLRIYEFSPIHGSQGRVWLTELVTNPSKGRGS